MNARHLQRLGHIGFSGWLVLWGLLCGQAAPASAAVAEARRPAPPAADALIVPREVNGPLLDSAGSMTLAFEPWSSRLAEPEARRLDRLAELMREQPDSRLSVVVPPAADDAARRFIAARLAVIDLELHRRGLFGRKLPLPTAEAPENVIVLRVALPVREGDGLASAGSSPVAESTSAAVPHPQDIADKPAVTGAPLPLLPPPSSAAAPASPVPAGDAPAPASPPALTAAPAAAPPIAAPSESTAAPAAVPVEASPAVAVTPLWTAQSGRMLRDVLGEWGERAGWTIIWQSDHEYPLEAAATFSGDFTEAAAQLFEGFATVAPAPFAHFYKGNHVLVVQSGEGR